MKKIIFSILILISLLGCTNVPQTGKAYHENTNDPDLMITAKADKILIDDPYNVFEIKIKNIGKSSTDYKSKISLLKLDEDSISIISEEDIKENNIAINEEKVFSKEIFIEQYGSYQIVFETYVVNNIDNNLENNKFTIDFQFE